MVTAAVLLDRDVTLGTFLRVGRDPVGRLRVVVALFDPLPQQAALHRIVPVFTALEAEHVVTLAGHRTRVHVLHLDRVVAVGGRAPAQESIALRQEGGREAWLSVSNSTRKQTHLDEAIRNQVLVLELDARVLDEPHHGHVVHEDVTAVGGTGDRLPEALLDDLRGQVLLPALGAEPVTTLQPSHHLAIAEKYFKRLRHILANTYDQINQMT